MLRSTIRDLIRKRLGETTAAFWTDAELNNWINMACQDLAFRVKCLKDKDYISSIESTADYSISGLDTSFLSPYRVYFNQDGTDWERIQPITIEELDDLYPGWKEVEDGIPTHYYWDLDLDTFSIYPTPNALNEGADYIEIYYYKKHTDLTLDSQSPTIPDPLQLSIVDWVCATGFDTRGWGDKANDAWQKYFSKINDYKAEKGREREDDDIISKNYRNI